MALLQLSKAMRRHRGAPMQVFSGMRTQGGCAAARKATCENNPVPNAPTSPRMLQLFRAVRFRTFSLRRKTAVGCLHEITRVLKPHLRKLVMKQSLPSLNDRAPCGTKQAANRETIPHHTATHQTKRTSLSTHQRTAWLHLDYGGARGAVEARQIATQT